MDELMPKIGVNVHGRRQQILERMASEARVILDIAFGPDTDERWKESVTFDYKPLELTHVYNAHCIVVSVLLAMGRKSDPDEIDKTASSLPVIYRFARDATSIYRTFIQENLTDNPQDMAIRTSGLLIRTLSPLALNSGDNRSIMIRRLATLLRDIHPHMLELCIRPVEEGK